MKMMKKNRTWMIMTTMLKKEMNDDDDDDTASVNLVILQIGVIFLNDAEILLALHKMGWLTLFSYIIHYNPLIKRF